MSSSVGRRTGLGPGRALGRRLGGWLVPLLLLALVVAVYLVVVVAFPVWRYWPAGGVLVGLAIVVPVVLGVASRRAKNRRTLESWRSRGIAEIDSMTGEQFERRLEVAFADLGWRVTPTSQARDLGCDLLLRSDDRLTVAVQCRCHGRPIDSRAVQEAHAARSQYHADEAWVVTNSTFTETARAQATGCGVSLLARPELTRLLVRASRTPECHVQFATRPPAW
ncbi:MAG: restriction endonuclease [Candidatus Dormiibacterota bacterium]